MCALIALSAPACLPEPDDDFPAGVDAPLRGGGPPMPRFDPAYHADPDAGASHDADAEGGADAGEAPDVGAKGCPGARLEGHGGGELAMWRRAVSAPVDVQVSDASFPHAIFAPAFREPELVRGEVDYTVFGALLGTAHGNLRAELATDPHVDFVHGDDVALTFVLLDPLDLSDEGLVELDLVGVGGDSVEVDVTLHTGLARLSLLGHTGHDVAFSGELEPGPTELTLRVRTYVRTTVVGLYSGPALLAEVRLGEAVGQIDRVDVAFEASTPWGDRDVFELVAITSESMLAVSPQLWTLDAPILSLDGVPYGRPGVGAPTWFGRDRFAPTREGDEAAGALAPFAFTGSPSILYALATILEPDGALRRQTFYSARGVDELQAALVDAYGEGAATIVASGAAFSRGEGEAGFVLDLAAPSCPERQAPRPKP
jgi:hypothetical protein